MGVSSVVPEVNLFPWYARQRRAMEWRMELFALGIAFGLGVCVGMWL